MENVTEADVAELAFGWVIEAGWDATARSMLRKVQAAAGVPA